jgi:hypothetical protein
MSGCQRKIESVANLKDLVYAPLGAVAEANIRLSSSIADFIASTGDVIADGSGGEIIQLRKIMMAYDQLRSDSMDNTVAESIGLEVPLLSIYPLSTLQVSKTKVSFGTEVQGMRNDADGVNILARVSATNQRADSSQSFIKYEIELESNSVAEGLARFVDILNTQSIPRRLHSRPLDDSGKRLTGSALEEHKRHTELAERESVLNSQLAEVREAVRLDNSTLEVQTGMNFEEYSLHIAHLRESGDESDINEPEAFIRISEKQDTITVLEEQLAAVRRELLETKLADVKGTI